LHPTMDQPQRLAHLRRMARPRKPLTHPTA
jgi:hypothetical protein